MTAPSEKLKILYLDDEDINLYIFEEFFKDYFEVVTTTSAETALTLLGDASAGIQVVITDLKMHPVSGMAFVARARDAGFSLPICVLSAFPKTPDIDAAITNGQISVFFNKPFDADLILRRIQSLVNGQDN